MIDSSLKQQLTQMMHEMMIMNKEIMSKGDYRDLISLCEKDITILACLENQQKLTAKEVSIIRHMPKTTVVTAVTRLEQRGYLERKQNEADKREMFLILTSKGRKANKEHFDYENLIIDALGERWKPSDQKELAQLLQRRKKVADESL